MVVGAGRPRAIRSRFAAARVLGLFVGFSQGLFDCAAVVNIDGRGEDLRKRRERQNDGDSDLRGSGGVHDEQMRRSQPGENRGGGGVNDRGLPAAAAFVVILKIAVLIRIAVYPEQGITKTIRISLPVFVK